jgi:hypothetical protein
VVFPEPAKPVIIVMGMREVAMIVLGILFYVSINMLSGDFR